MIDSDAPHDAELPDGWEKKLSHLQRVLAIRAFREEKLLFATRVYVGRAQGKVFTESPPFDLEGSYDDSTNKMPLIFILSPGADPNEKLLSFADERGKGLSGGLRIISLGQGQGPIAEKLMKEGRDRGNWVCLQNCHLYTSWMVTLEQAVESMGTDEDMHKDYRLWLTSMPTLAFPIPVLQVSIKLTNEPPAGIRANLKALFGAMTDAEYENCEQLREYKKLLCALVFTMPWQAKGASSAPLGGISATSG
jgi:dynein heavy chain